MTNPVAGVRETRLVHGLAIAVLAAAAIRLLAAVIAGFLEWRQSDALGVPGGSIRASDLLLTFGGAGDGVGVLLAVAAAVLLWRRAGVDGSPASSAVAMLLGVFVLTGLSAVAQGIGYVVAYSTSTPKFESRLALSLGDAAAYALVAVAGFVATRRFEVLYASAGEPPDVDDGDGALVFAVDRGTGDVRAFFSLADAARKMHVYSVEDDEFAFYTDEGVVVEATAADDRVLLRPTQTGRPDELLERLRAFATRRGIRVDDPDDATAYVAPISDWQWLQLWPGWLRWMGRVFRPR